MIKSLAAAALGAVILMGGSASAATILAFGQSGNGSPVAATNNGLGGTQGGTTITGIDVPVTITSYGTALPATPFSGFLTLQVSSTSSAAVIPFLLEVGQEYSGSFSIRSATGGGGINYLSGVFDDVFVGLGSGASVSASTPGRMVIFTSDLLPPMVDPMAISFGFTNISPIISTTLCGPDGDRTVCAFTSNISGNMSAGTTTPEVVPTPASLPIFLTGLLMAGMIGHYHRATVRG